MLILAGDIGGTKTILRLVKTSESSSQLETLAEKQYPSQEFPDLVPMVRQFLQGVDVLTPDVACFGIAGPVVDDTAQLTNLNWFLDAPRLQRDLGISQVSLINDFAAVGYGVLGLEPTDIHTLQPGKPKPGAPIAVIGAGTGLGHCFLIPQGDSYQVFSSEGGHADFSPRNQWEFQLLEYILETKELERVSIERVISGPGISIIYQFFRDLQVSDESPEIAQLVRSWEKQAETPEIEINPAGAIAQAAIEKRDRLCEETMRLFVQAYGAEVGNFALKLLPYGGMYVAGGIAPKNLPLLKTEGFLDAFVNKGRMKPLLDSIPLHIVLNPKVGLIGAAIHGSRIKLS
ncbi:glucokinase [Merismopedia glauca]|uniref:Glucokinase n=1 Tax=Merismopedia glauca CCAP 1448/3 TaxID=1296344 RepID=A0A2T1CAF2_9CYAN|nr:glucokinase [Merismopedia glauca]PSB05250.1 glucokinase [Merismopedia glauca CCAP 1448/3]